MQLPEFHYPMFVTTPEEKALLRKAELHLANNCYKVYGICAAIADVSENEVNSYTWQKLRYKIGRSMQGKTYIDDASELKATLQLLTTTATQYVEGKNLIRRIWITKLLNYK